MPVVPAADPQAPPPDAVQPAGCVDDGGQPRMGDLRRHRGELVDIRWRRPGCAGAHRAGQSRRRRDLSAALHPQRVGMACDPAADLVAAAGAVDARQVLPLRRVACRRRTCRDALVPDPRHVDDPRRCCRCRRGAPRPHDPRGHHRHDVHGDGRDGTASAARSSARPLRGDSPVLWLGGARAGVDQHHAVRRRSPRRPITGSRRC